MYYNKVQNVFDEIYYTWDGNLFVQTDFTNVPALNENRIQGYVYPGDNKISDVLKLSFEDSFIKDNTMVLLNIYPTDRKIHMLCVVYFDGSKEIDPSKSEELLLSFYYEVKSKTLTVKPIQAASNSLIKKNPERYKRYQYYSNSEYIDMFMEEHSTTKKDIEEYKEYFVNDVLIGMWLDGNAKESRFTRENVGDFVIQDNLFENLSE